MSIPTLLEQVASSFGSGEADTGTVPVAVTMGSALLFGCIAVSISLRENGTVWNGLMWAAAWSSFGWFLGFLFGIPRYLSTDTARLPDSPMLTQAKRELSKALEDAGVAHEKAAAATTAQQSAALDLGKLEKTLAQATQDVTSAATALAANPADADLIKAHDEATKAEAAASTSRTDADDLAIRCQLEAEAAAVDAARTDELVRNAERRISDLQLHAKTASGSSLTVNTNLEQISDWLTKIIVGVSLVEAQTLLLKMQSAATYMAKSMATSKLLSAMAVGAPPMPVQADATAAVIAQAASTALQQAQSRELFSSTESFAYAIMLYFFATGLLGSYLLTRLFLQRALNEAARGSPV